MKLVWERLAEMEKDLQALAAELNRDGLFGDARRAQEAICAVGELRARATWPDCAAWPPKVSEDVDGVTTWDVLRG